MAETSEKKSSKKLIVIIAIVVLLIGAAGAGGYFFLMHKPAEGEHQADAGKHAADKKEDTETEEVAEPEVYYELTEPFLVNFPPGSSAKVIKIALTVLIKGEANVEVMKKHLPMIRNNLLMTISSLSADKAQTLEGKKELQTMMLNEVGKVMEKMAHKNPVQDVYFTEFVMQ